MKPIVAEDRFASFFCIFFAVAEDKTVIASFYIISHLILTVYVINKSWIASNVYFGKIAGIVPPNSFFDMDFHKLHLVHITQYIPIKWQIIISSINFVKYRKVNFIFYYLINSYCL